MSAEAWSAWPAPAKLNLFLHITGRRDDGLHELQTVFRLLEWGDTVELRVREDGEIRRDGGDTIDIPEDQDLAVRAARALRDFSGTMLGADLRVAKSIPAGGGFGGGSSDAATVLRALDRLWGTNLGEDTLARLGLALGADVPVFVRGRNAWAEGLGQHLFPVELPPAWYLIVEPGVHVPTRELFQAPELTRDAAPATISDFVSGTVLGNAFEPVLRRRQPQVDAVLTELSRHGQAHLTGTGSGCFVSFDNPEAAQEARAAMPVSWRCRVVEGAARSPLLAALGL